MHAVSFGELAVPSACPPPPQSCRIWRLIFADAKHDDLKAAGAVGRPSRLPYAWQSISASHARDTSDRCLRTHGVTGIPLCGRYTDATAPAMASVWDVSRNSSQKRHRGSHAAQAHLRT